MWDEDEISLCAIKKDPPFAGGQKVEEREFPHMALIGYSHNVTSFGVSSVGALISKRFVLSSAHSANVRQESEAKWVVLGDIAHGARNKNIFFHGIIQKLIHPQYESDSIDYDIALYKLDKDVTFNAYVVPICLPQFDHKTEDVIGSHWDVKRFHLERNKAPLRKNSLNIMSARECQDHFRSDELVTTGINYGTKICATSVYERSDTCWDNSGT